MKKLASLLCCLLLVGCSTNTITQEEYDKLVKENQTLTSKVEKLTDQLSKYDDIVDVKISGGFVAEVIGMYYDPETENGEMRYLTVKRFQGDHELIRVSSKVAEKININTAQTYYFEIETTIVEKDVYSMSVDDVNSALGDNIYAYHWINVLDVRKPLENELGLSETLVVEEVK